MGCAAPLPPITQVKGDDQDANCLWSCGRGALRGDMPFLASRLQCPSYLLSRSLRFNSGLCLSLVQPALPKALGGQGI
jgi:hypothetical protein